MRPTSIYDISPAIIQEARQRLLREHSRLGSWHRVATRRRVNVRYVHAYAVRGVIPQNPDIRRRLGIKRLRTINEHLSQDAIQDMPAPLLAWAFANREEMQCQ